MRPILLSCFFLVTFFGVDRKGQAFTYTDQQQDTLQTFFLSYAEWSTITCVISADTAAYWNKEMIALIEPSGKLRIKHENKVQYLSPLKDVRIKEGKWSTTYRNDSIEITITTIFKKGEILNCLTGAGKLTLKANEKIIEKNIYLVYTIK